jgi:hypothetical protein
MKRSSKLSAKRNALAHTPFAGSIAPSTAIRLIFDDDDTELGFNFASERSFSITNIENFPHAIERLTWDFVALLFESKVYASAKIHRAPQNDPNPQNGLSQPVSTPEGNGPPPQSSEV